MPNKNTFSEDQTSWADHAQALGKELGGHLKGLKKKYDGLDEHHKKALLAGLAGVTAILAGSHAVKKHKKKKAKEAKTNKKK